MKNIVLTSNGYVNVLSGFAYLFNKFYPNQEVTVVRYDVRPPKLPANFNQFAIGLQSDYSWSGGLKYYLESIDDEFVMLMLDDYYLDKPVDVSKIDCLRQFIEFNSKVVKIDLTNDRSKVKHDLYEDSILTCVTNNGQNEIEMIQSDINAPFLASVQAAIWRKDFLIAILNNKDNAWQFEKNKRTKKYLQDNNAVILGCVNPPMSYVNAVGGEGNNPGQYDLKKIPSWMIDELKANGVWKEK